jgi:F420-non-reducing hydrogenase iron-sulfur subunit
MKLLKRVLEQFGIESERVRLEWISASEGEKFATVVKDMVEQIRKLGPNPLKGGFKT